MPSPDRHDCAVALCCDRKYFPLALFMIRQIGFHNPARRFDFVISTRDELELPVWARELGIVLHRPGELPDHVGIKSYTGSRVPLDRLLLPQALGSRYRRILYLDCDMFIDGGDLNRLIEIDIGQHPFGAVLDAPYLYDQAHHAREFLRLGLPALPYANSGLLLIDTKAFTEADFAHRAFDVCRTDPQAIVYSDQSLINLAARGKFAQLAPCWNWQNAQRLPFLSQNYPVFIWHFIARWKPDRAEQGHIEARFAQAYRDFATQLMPEFLERLPPARDPAPLSLGQIFKLGLHHYTAHQAALGLFAQFPDPYRAKV
jgi:hypothetical protein